jgi:tRNA pseudouridine55 synthase
LGIDAAPALSGALLVDKPRGPTSHDVVAFVRRAFGVPRVGHTGTLDPLATGLLVLLVGSATRLARFLAADEKEYIADVRLGVATPTYDAASLDAEVGGRRPETGQSLLTNPPTDAEIEAVLARFRGAFLQIPPPFSAKKIASVPAYARARKNQAVELEPVRVTVRELHVLPPSPPTSNLQPPASDLRTRDATLVRLRVAASAGFYVRSLAHDVGQALGCGAHLEALRRTRVGRFCVEDALTLDRIEPEGPGAVIALNDLLVDMPAVTLTAEGARRAAHGNSLAPPHLEKADSPLVKGDSPLFSEQEKGTAPFKKGAVPFLRVLDGSGTLVAVAERRPDGLLQPLVVLR